MNNDFMFGPMGGAPTISGKWYNKRTGNTIVVRDAFFMDNGMQVQTSTGEFIDGQTFSNEYIQMDEKVYDENGNVTGTETIDYDAMFNENISFNKTGESTQECVLADFIAEPTNEPAIVTGFNENNQPASIDASMYEPAVPVKVSTLDTYKLDILNKFFNSFKELPDIKFSVKWDNLPEYEINLMKNVFNISVDDIAVYITEKYCDVEKIIDNIKCDIIDKLDKKEEISTENVLNVNIEPIEESQVEVNEITETIEEVKPKRGRKSAKNK